MPKFDSNTESGHSDSTALVSFSVSQTKETPLFNSKQHFAQMAAEALRLRAELEARNAPPSLDVETQHLQKWDGTSWISPSTPQVPPQITVKVPHTAEKPTVPTDSTEFTDSPKFGTSDPGFLAFTEEVEAIRRREAAFVKLQQEIQADHNRAKLAAQAQQLENPAEDVDEFADLFSSSTTSKPAVSDADVFDGAVFSAEDEARYEAYHQNQAEEQVQAEQVQCTHYLAQNTASIPNPRALSTKSKAQLEETAQRRAQWDALEQRQKQSGPAAVGRKIIANITAQLEGQTPTPISDEDRAMEATFQQMSLFMDSPQVAQLDLGLHWKRAIHMLEPVKTLLGTAYLPTVYVLTLASGVGRSPEELERLHQYTGYAGEHKAGEPKPANLEHPDSEFFVAMWEIATMCGITDDYLRKIFHRHAASLRKIFHHHDLKNTINITGVEKVWIVGCLFRVRWPEGGAEQYTPEMIEKGRKTQTVYRSLTNRNRVYRDLKADVFNKHTQAAYRKAGKLISNAPGKAKNLTLEAEYPQGFSLEMFTFCAGRIRGLTSTNVSDIERFGSQVTRINTLCHLLEQPIEKGHNKLQNRVWAVTDMLCQTLEGSTDQNRGAWLQVAWTLYRTNKIVWLYQAVWDVLIRAGDLGTIRSKGALVRHLLNQRGYADLRATLEAQHPEEIAA